ncbi:MAG: 50S ribosomal protein L30 [Vampirovibrio sp.]|nr:50S ribosomal protein L30 [Vampirovibrio sp.]
MSEKKLNIKLTRSLIGRPEKHRRVAQALGLKKMGDTVTHHASATIEGMARKISHLLTVEAV